MTGSFYEINPFDTRGWNEPFRVEFIVYGERMVMFKKVEVFIEAFQIYKDITVDILPHTEEMTRFIDKVEDWVNTEHFIRLQTDIQIRRLQSYEPDDVA